MLCRLLSSVLLAVYLPTCAFGQDLRLVSGEDYAPFVGSNLPGGGMLTQIVQAAFTQQGLSTTLTWLPWKRGYLETFQAKYSATFPYVRTLEREQAFLYSAPIYTFKQRLYSRAGEVYEPDNLPALKGKRFCYPLGWQAPAAIQQMLDNHELQLHSPKTLAACAELLLRNRDDFFLTNELLGDFVLREIGEQSLALRTSESSFPTNTLHLLVSRKHPQADSLLRSFDEGLAALHESGQYQRLIELYWLQSAKMGTDHD